MTRRAVFLAALAAALLLGACGKTAARRPDLILISIDTLRPDRLGCYGYPLPTSPRIDALRAEGVLFRTALAQAPSTLSSHASLLTSVSPVRHGASFALRRRLPEEATTVAEALQAAGYRTISVTAAGQMAPAFGLGQGFEVYRARSEPQEAGAFWARVGTAIRLLEKRDERPVFLFLHTYEIHHPYYPDPEILARFDPDYAGTLGDRIPVSLLTAINNGEMTIDAADRRRIEAAYAAEIASVDRAIGRLVDWLAASRRYRDAAIVVTSDHGEEFGEHGSIGWHSHTLYDELLRVPLIVRLPERRRAGHEVTMPVRLLDVAPTLLELAGVSAPAAFEGRSLLGLIGGDGGTGDRELPAPAHLDNRFSNSHAVRWRGWKLYDGRLFDLDADPLEQSDRTGAQPTLQAGLQEILERELAAGPSVEGSEAVLDEAQLRELESLGYL